MKELINKFPYKKELFQVFSHLDCLLHEGREEHPETPIRLAAILEACKEIDPLVPLSFSSPEPATMSQLELVHDKFYLMGMEASCMKMRSTYMSEDNHICMDSYTSVLAAGGSALALADTLANGGSGFALIRPPGHHAGKNIAEGFCFINHVSLAVERIRQTQPEAEFLVVDFDVHHGNGIDSIYRNCPQVYYFSLHGSPQHIYPNTGHKHEIGHGDGEGYTCNITLPLGTSGDVWLDQFKEHLYQFEGKIKPDYVLVSAGFDAHKEDPYGLMGVDDHHYLEAVKALQEVADKYSEGRLGLFLEGGYSVEVLERLVPKIIEQLALFKSQRA